MRVPFLLGAAALLGFTAAVPAAAQGPFTGKPVYQIQAKRAGQPIGTITVELFPLIAPRHVRNFDSLVAHNFYDSTAFHRVVPGFVIQGGDPNSRHGPRSTWGYGQAGQPTVPAEFSAISHQRGIMSAARSSNINSATSQFFICVAPATQLDNQYSAYGRVVDGMSVVDDIVSSPRDARDNPLQKIEMFVTRTGSNDSVPLTPAIVSPANGYLGAQATQPLVWGRVQDAMIYNVQLATDSLFTNLLYSVDLKQTVTSYTANSLQPNSTYYWRARANNGGKLSPWSAAARFQTGAVAPALVAPANGYNAATTAQTVQWAPLSGATSYHLQVSTSALFTPGSIIADQSGISDTLFTLSGLQVTTRYYWRVQAESSGVPGFFSAPWNFRVTTVAAAPEAAAGRSLQLEQNVPNPATAGTIISYYLPQPGLADLRLYDALGREVAVLQTGQTAAGQHQVQLDATALPAGVYFYRLQTGPQQLSRKMLRY